ncbi:MULTISPECIES: class I SAM-dependent methyltransferase [Olivibacter]|uniref:Class I SAM-dependent methyltransferase n=1 Tax=Olivibacter oleidegradans TaxID=760123 RepID=A0ABV6HIL5_9SPHI|nr:MULTISPECIES: class I SAM-dependent methyltransferase [Olivibacter]MDM8175913.1 methyltransferase domain-containing protein [Olivibacter sp. 47]
MKKTSMVLVIVITFAAMSPLMAQERGHGHETYGIKSLESSERDAYQRPEKVLQYLGDIKDKTVMDIGAGTGYFSVKLADKGARVIAADVDDQLQTYLKERIEKNNLKNIELRKIPYNSPSLQKDEVDMVFMANTYHHIKSRPDYFAKVKRGTKENGTLVIIDFFKIDLPVGPPTSEKVSLDDVIFELKAAGYTTFAVEVGLLPYQFIVKAN